MVRQCYVCKVHDYKPEAKYLTFHRLPQNIERRRLWLSALGYDEHHQFPKRVEICSNHFNTSDFEHREDGSMFLNKDAVPNVVHTAFDPSSSGTSSSISIGGASDKADKVDTSSTDSESSLVTLYEKSCARKRLKLDDVRPSTSVTSAVGESKYEGSTSSTSTASEVEQLKTQDVTEEANITETAASEQRVDSVKRQRKRKTYVGDLSSGDFSSPQKAKENGRRVKSVVHTYRKKIKTLQTTVGALRKRNKTLNGLFRELKQSCSISHESEAVLRVI